MNIVQLQEQLKNFSQDQLVKEMQMPSGTAPQFLVLGEIMRRQKMQQDFSAQQAKGQPQSTVAEDAIAAAGVPQGGLAGMARALAPKTDMAGNTGVQAMADGGYVEKMKKGGKALSGLSDEDRAKVMAAADVRAGLHPLYKLMKIEADKRGVSIESLMDSFFGKAAGKYGSPVDSGLYPAPATSAGPEFLPGLTEEERQKVMLGADMRALGRRSYLADQANKQGVSPEALMGRYGLYETGLAPSPEDPAAPQRLYRDELIAAAGGMDRSGPYAYLFDQGDARQTSANPSYTEDRPDRFPEEAPRLPMTGYSLPLPDEMTSYERRQNSELEQPLSWFRGQSPRLVAAAMPPAGDPVPPMSGLGMEPVLEFLPGLTDAEKQRVMLIADMRAFGRRGYNTAASARREGTTPEAIMGRRKIYNTGLYPEPINPAEMADGGYVQKMKKGGQIIVRNGRQYEVLPDGTFIDLATGQRTLLPSNTMVPQAEYDGSISLAAPSGAAAREYLDNQMARPGDYQAEANLARLAAARQAPRSPYETITQFDVDATGPGGGPIPDDGRTWGQRNIGDPIRDFFQPFRENAPQFVLGPAPVEPPPVLARQAQFEPVGLSSPSAMDAARQAAAMLGAEPAAMTPYEAITRFDIEPGAGRVGLATGQLPVLSEVEKQRLAGNEAFTLPELLRDKLGVTFDLSGAGSGLTGVRGFPVVGGGSEKVAPEIAPLRGPAGAPAAVAKTAEEVAAEKAAAEQAAAEKAAAAQGGTGGAGGAGGGGGIAGLGGMSSYEQELMDALKRREKAAEQDKWLALAQVGLNMMSSTQPTLLGAIGEAGVKGVEAARSARDQYDKDRLELQGALEQARMARAAASARTAGGGGGAASAGGIAELGLSAGEGRLLTQIGSDIDRLSLIVNDPYMRGAIAEGIATPEEEIAYQDAVEELAAVRATRRALLYGVMGGGASGSDTYADLADE